jgi:hypothetical protein
LSSCAGHGLSRNPAVYPHAGFGRIGCFAGASLAPMGSDSLDPDGSQALERGPWLVLDSLDPTELVRFPDEGARTGARVFRADTIVRHFISWERIHGDSIIVHESAFFASTTWRLHMLADSVRGTARLPHDVFTIVDGRREQSVSRWDARGRRVPCASVPIAVLPRD